MSNTTAAQFPSILRDDLTLVEVAGNNPAYTVLEQSIPATDHQYIIPVASLAVTASFVVDADSISPKTGRDAGTRYVYDSPTKVHMTDGPDNHFGYVRNTVGSAAFNPADPSTFLSGFAAGYQIVNVGGAKTALSSSGLANNGTVYTASVLIDGATTKSLSVVGSTAQTYGALIALLTPQLGADAVVAIVGGNIKITSTKVNKGANSAVAITDTNLFSTLTGYVAILTAVAGISPVDAMTFNKLDGNGVKCMALVADSSVFETPVLAINSPTASYVPA